jgi:hypothetical protein
MGQYYKPVLLNNNLDIVAWAYSHNYDNGLKLMEHSYVGNTFVALIEKQLYLTPLKLCWDGDYSDKGYYDRVKDETEIIDTNIISRSKFKFILNHETKEFCKIPEETDDLVIHPLPLLTSSGNGRGGGDYSGINMELVGIWSEHELEIVEKVPYGYDELVAEFEEIW